MTLRKVLTRCIGQHVGHKPDADLIYIVAFVCSMVDVCVTYMYVQLIGPATYVLRILSAHIKRSTSAYEEYELRIEEYELRMLTYVRRTFVS